VVKLKIDGKLVKVDKKTTILNAAKEIGIEIPTLCHHPAIEPYQACRVCLVELIKDGKSTLVTSCGYKVEKGIEVRTDSDKVLRTRKLIVELLLAEAPTSPKIREIAENLGIKETRFEQKDEKECILCGLCTRVCNEIMGLGVIGFAHRGANREIVTPYKELSELCSTCGACSEICPTGVMKLEDVTKNKVVPILSEFELGLSTRPCVYIPFPQAVPNKPIIDRENCMYFKNETCKICETVCQPEAIVFDQEDKFVEEEVGAIVVATGYELYPIINLEEYGAGEIEDVIDGLAFERLLSSSGPTDGEIRRPSDGKIVKDIVFIQCAGSRDPEKHKPYCSRICCMYSTKQAMLYKHRVYEGQPYIFYIDIRSGGKGYEEFVERAQREDGVIYIRGKVSKLYRDNQKIKVVGVDTIANKTVEIDADLVVLAMAMVPTPGTKALANTLKIQVGENGFLKEAHPKLRPLESITAGYYLAGCAQGPKDIPDVVSQASGTASKVVSLFSGEYLQLEPTIATVDEELCSACRICISVCPYKAREFDEEKGIAIVNEALCESCGSCVAACPSGASSQRNLTDKQISTMATSILKETEDN